MFADYFQIKLKINNVKIGCIKNFYYQSFKNAKLQKQN